ncbi:putative N-acetylglucosaminyltransferase [Cryptosporidium felis]|nr:putative N-acetylglucosaminyltransferase [Cryptosporidium felis]
MSYDENCDASKPKEKVTTPFCFCGDSNFLGIQSFRDCIIKEADDGLFEEGITVGIGIILIETLKKNELFQRECNYLSGFICSQCKEKASVTDDMREFDIKNSVLYIGMIFLKLRFYLIKFNLENQETFDNALVEFIKNCVGCYMLKLDSLKTPDESHLEIQTDKLICLAISLGITYITLKSYDDAYFILNYVGLKFPDVDRLVKCLRESILVTFRSKRVDDSEIRTKSHFYFTNCFLFYPNIVHCFVRSVLSFHGLELNLPPFENIEIQKINDLSVYNKCRKLLEECFELSKMCSNFEMDYVLSRLYFEVDGDADRSIEIMENILERTPFNENYRLYFGRLLYFKATDARKSNDLKSIKSILKRTIFYVPQSSDVYNDLAIIYCELGKKEKAIYCFELSIHFNPQNLNALNNLGTFFRKFGFIKEAISCYEKIYLLNPACVNSLNIIAALHCSIGEIDESFEYFRKCIEIDSQIPDVFNNLGVLFRDCGNFVMAKNCFLMTLELDKNHIMAFQNLLYILNYFIPLRDETLKGKFRNFSKDLIFKTVLELPRNPCLNADNNFEISIYNSKKWIYNSEFYVYFQDMHKISLEWGAGFTEIHRNAKEVLDSILPIAEIPKIKAPGSLSEIETINIGFVGAEFFHHAVAFFIFAPIKFLSESLSMKSSCQDVQDPRLSGVKFNIFIYDNSPHNDYYSCFFKELVDSEKWRYIQGKDVISISKLIRTDKIHVLFDLSGHTVNNCLGVFAIRNAPIQISWIGYPNTTGLKYIDYRITDKFADSTDSVQEYSEKLIYLPNNFLCYTIPKIESPPVGEPPLIKNGFVTFGSFNRVTKLHPFTIDLWGEVLRKVPNSHLILKSKAFTSNSCCRFYLDIFKSKYGIDSGRISLVPLSSSYYSHLDLYNRIDISLDTFPYAGTTTTFECIFMGVPLITFCVEKRNDPHEESSDPSIEISSFHSQNVGKSILTNLKMEELIAKSKHQFVEVAVNLAGDPEKLKFYRLNLRNTLINSDLCNGKKFGIEFATLIVDTIMSHNR